MESSSIFIKVAIKFLEHTPYCEVTMCFYARERSDYPLILLDACVFASIWIAVHDLGSVRAYC